jgi:hypothetical protein
MRICALRILNIGDILYLIGRRLRPETPGLKDRQGLVAQGVVLPMDMTDCRSDFKVSAIGPLRASMLSCMAGLEEIGGGSDDNMPLIKVRAASHGSRWGNRHAIGAKQAFGVMGH